MPRLNNDADADVFAPQIHQMVPGRDWIDITDAEAALFEHNCIFTVTDGSEPVDGEPVEAVGEQSEPTAPATRRTVTRGSKRGETTTAPSMEKR